MREMILDRLHELLVNQTPNNMRWDKFAEHLWTDVMNKQLTNAGRKELKQLVMSEVSLKNTTDGELLAIFEFALRRSYVCM